MDYAVLGMSLGSTYVMQGLDQLSYSPSSLMLTLLSHPGSGQNYQEPLRAANVVVTSLPMRKLRIRKIMCGPSPQLMRGRTRIPTQTLKPTVLTHIAVDSYEKPNTQEILQEKALT